MGSCYDNKPIDCPGLANIEENLIMLYGGGDYTYKVDQDWGRLPEGHEFNQVAGVAVDKEDNVYLYNRSEHQVMVFEKNGDFLLYIIYS